jgi:hypothetical protein
MTVVELDAWYVYGVVPAGTEPPEGITLVEQGPVAAAVATVPLSDFGEDALAEHLNDREWLEEHAREHEQVLQRVAASADVVPFRFGTIYRDRAHVEALLAGRRDELVGALEHVRGRMELGVKVWADRARLAAGAEDAAPATGRAYLERRRSEQDRAQELRALLGETARTVHARLVARAVDGVANRPQPPELSGRDETMILNGAYLVAAGDTTLAAEVDALEAEHVDDGITFELTGPWPPYNFVSSEATA